MDILGKMLVAPPHIEHEFFENAVILITERHVEGTVGVLLNTPSKVSVNEFAQRNGVLVDQPDTVHVGGIVTPTAITMLHTNDWWCSNTLKVNDQFSISSSKDILTKMAKNDVPDKWRLFAGVCFWKVGLLEEEIDDRWLVVTPTNQLIFNYNGQFQWAKSIEQAAVEFAQNALA